MTTSERIYKHAEKDLGLSETPGPKSTPRIAFAIKTAASWLGDGVKDLDGSIPWCGCLRGLWGLETATGVPTAHYRARNWLKWGKEVQMADAREGDTVVLKRKGGGHVGLFVRQDKLRVWILGGNQANTTSIAPFSKSIVEGVRRLPEPKSTDLQ